MASGLRPADVAIAAGVLFGTIAFEAFRLARRFGSRTAEQKRENESHELSMILRVICMTAAGPLFFVLLLVTPTGYANPTIVTLIALVSIWFEGTPRHLSKRLGVVEKARRAVFRKA